MSLTRAEQARTRFELQANFRLSEVEPEDVRADLGFTATQLDVTLQLGSSANPVDVWLLRDYLDREIVTRGGVPVPYSVLTDAARGAAEGWFSLRPVPESRRLGNGRW